MFKVLLISLFSVSSHVTSQKCYFPEGVSRGQHCTVKHSNIAQSGELMNGY